MVKLVQSRDFQTSFWELMHLSSPLSPHSVLGTVLALGTQPCPQGALSTGGALTQSQIALLCGVVVCDTGGPSEPCLLVFMMLRYPLPLNLG